MIKNMENKKIQDLKIATDGHHLRLQMMPICNILIAFLFFLLSNQAYASTFGISMPSNSLGLVGWWTFDGKDVVNGVALDKSGNGNNGNLINIATSTFYAQGKIGQAFNFDGVNDYVSFPAATIINNMWATGATISYWVKPTTCGGGGAGYWLYSDGGNNWLIFADQGDASGLHCGMEFDIDFSGNTAKWRGDIPVSMGTWNHVVLTYDGSSTTNKPTVYVNNVAYVGGGGIFNTVVTPIGTISSYVGHLDVGGNPTSSRTSNGIMDDVRIYNRALSQAEITQLYNMGR